MANITVKIVTPEKIYLEESCEMVTAPSSEGELGLSASHIPLLANLKTGYIKLYNGSNVAKEIFVATGILKFENDQAVILTEKIIDLKNLDQADLDKNITEQNKKIAEHLKNGNDKKLDEAQAQLESLQAIKAAA